MKRLLLILVMITSASICQAHKQSDSYLTLDATAGTNQVQGRWDIALRDLDFAIGLDANADAAITWGEVRSRRDAIGKYAFDRLELQGCPTLLQNLLIDDHVDGRYAVLQFTATCAAVPTQLVVRYWLLQGIDPNHHGLLDVRARDFSQSSVLSAQGPAQTIDLQSANGWQQLRSFLVEGIWHIWMGYDHILFLFTLLLPAVVVYRNGAWQGRASWREASIDILKVVTAFTLAHSLTLSLAALGVIKVPSRIVESAIAVTVLLGALNILFPVVRERRWLIALGFGLVHGLGFASVLADLGLASGSLLRALVGFNVGVEIGQLAIVLVLMPLIFMVRDTLFYRRIALPVGATAISVLAVYWLASRAIPDFPWSFI
ncbi:MAG: HupE/UreJ family protein [Steroidobacteraceae bacterium]